MRSTFIGKIAHVVLEASLYSTLLRARSYVIDILIVFFIIPSFRLHKKVDGVFPQIKIINRNTKIQLAISICVFAFSCNNIMKIN